MKGRFITFEGTEGSGKSTQIERLRGHLAARGIDVLVTREPGGTPIAEAIREILLDTRHAAMTSVTELFLYEAARAQHVTEKVRPALLAGTWVLCDRYVDSTTAYQGAGRGLPTEVLERFHEIAAGGLWPHLTFVLDIPVEAGLERAGAGRRYDRIEAETIDFHRRVRDGYLALAQRHPERIRVIDASGAVETVAEVIRRNVDESAL